ncbi:TRAP transporter small permease [Devosia salina]|uniref:TRAP transporter small permease protein n=1 Tax=Devosia salina TaxID=2860336 RepID=A0ABX8WE84_9HYPH|nr:TRAP transporter small permease [Devosia salina]QYO77219.1 TRAP transporter small permease [Devosia salina]
MFRDESLLGRLIVGLAKWLAVAGGLVLMAMVAMIVVSIIGRALLSVGLKPITGDYELVSIGMGFAVFAFLPWAHLQRGHALVSLVTDSFGQTVNNWILVITDIMVLVASAFIAWRLYFGMMDKFAYKETTLLLRFPLGWAYAVGFVGAVAMVIVAIYVLGRSLSYALSGQAEPKRAGAEL